MRPKKFRNNGRMPCAPTTFMSLSLKNFLSQLGFASALFDDKENLIEASPSFFEIFSSTVESRGDSRVAPTMRGTSTLKKIFSNHPTLQQKALEVLTKRTRFYLYEHPLSVGATSAVGRPLQNESVRLFHIEIYPVFGDDQNFCGVVIHFFPAHKQSLLSEQIQRTDALARLNLIASGLAHEIKNPLSGLKGAAQLIQSDLDNTTQLKNYSHIIIQEAERINRLVQELLDFTKPKILNQKSLNVNQILHEVLQTIKLSEKKAITYQENFDPSLPQAKLDEDAFRQICLNLIKNAVEAISSQGIIKIKTYIVTDFVLKKEKKKHQILGIQIFDTGCGLSEKEQKQIFTPYYTTKAKGTGLGLALVNQLVELHGGSVSVKSKKGEGSTFTVFLPFSM